ncbi:MAG: sugar-binding domain-containing protein [Chloroflexota bacterium]
MAQPHDPGELARVLADRLGATCHPLYAPAFVASAEVRAVLLGESEISRTTDLFGAVTLAIVGIGELSGSRDGSALVRSELLSPEDVRRLRRSGALGDLLVHAFDARGRFIPDPLSDRAIAMTPEQPRRVPRVVAVAGGARKARAIAGALATGIVRMLITDGTAARELLAPGARTACGDPDLGGPSAAHACPNRSRSRWMPWVGPEAPSERRNQLTSARGLGSCYPSRGCWAWATRPRWVRTTSAPGSRGSARTSPGAT